MKKVLVNLSLLCLLAALALPLGACKKEEMEIEEAPGAASEPMEPAMSEPAMGSDMGTMGTEPMGTGMGTEMGTDMGTEMGTETTPPAAQ